MKNCKSEMHEGAAPQVSEIICGAAPHFFDYRYGVPRPKTIAS